MEGRPGRVGRAWDANRCTITAMSLRRGVRLERFTVVNRFGTGGRRAVWQRMSHGGTPGPLSVHARTIVGIFLVAILGASCGPPEVARLPVGTAKVRNKAEGANLAQRLTAREAPEEVMLPCTLLEANERPIPNEVDECYTTVSLSRSGTVAAATFHETYVRGAGQQTVRVAPLNCRSLVADEAGGLWCYGAQFAYPSDEGTAFSLGFSRDGGATWMLTALPSHVGRSNLIQPRVAVRGGGLISPDDDTSQLWHFSFLTERSVIRCTKLGVPPPDFEPGYRVLLDQSSICWKAWQREGAQPMHQAVCSHDQGGHWTLLDLDARVSYIESAGRTWWRTTRDGKLTLSQDKGTSWQLAADASNRVGAVAAYYQGAFVFEDNLTARTMLQLDNAGRRVAVHPAPPPFVLHAKSIVDGKLVVGALDGVMILDNGSWRLMLPRARCETVRKEIKKLLASATHGGHPTEAASTLP